MPKRFSIGPLGEYDDYLLLLYARLHGQTKAVAANRAIADWLEQNRRMLFDQIEELAKIQGKTSAEVIQELLDDEESDDAKQE